MPRKMRLPYQNRFFPLCAIVLSIGLVSLPTMLFAQTDKPKENPGKAAVPPKALSIAFFQLEAQGVETKVSSLVTDMILSEMKRMKGSRIIGSKEIDAMLGFEQKKQMTGCTDTSCMVAIGGALGVDKILMGSVGKLGNSYMINLKLINIQAGTIEEMYSKRIKGGSEEDFLDIIPEALAVLFPTYASNWVKTDPGQRPAAPAAPMEVMDLQRTPSSIKVPEKGSPSTPVKDTEKMDEKPVVKAEAKAEAKKASPDLVTVTKAATPSAGPGFYPWIVVGAGAAVVVSGAVVHILARSDYNTWKDLKESDPQFQSTKDSIATKQTTAFVCYGIGGAAAVGGLVWYFLSDSGSPSKSSGRTTAAPGVLTISPLWAGASGIAVDGSW